MIVEALKELGITNDFAVDADVETEEHYKRSFKDISGENRFIEWSKVKSKMDELQAEYDAKSYARARADAYPSWQTQMDLLYHGGVDALKAELKKTKDKYPKPT